MKKKISEANTEKIFREFYGAGTFIEKSAIPSEYGFKSKNEDSDKEGYPDFFYESDDCEFVIVVEAKKNNHNLAEKEVQFYMKENELTQDVIGMAVSGQDSCLYKVTYYLKKFGEKSIKKLDVDTLITIDNIKKVYKKSKGNELTTEENLVKTLNALNKQFHNEDIVRDTDRSLFFSGIMIALKDPTFRNTYKSIQKPTEAEAAQSKAKLYEAHNLSEAIVNAIDRQLSTKINNLSKEYNWRDRFTFIKSIDYSLVKFKNLIKTIENNIFIPFENEEKQDILGRAYKIFLSKAGKVDNKNIILTPDHIKELMVKLARLNVDDVVLDTCTGSGGFLMEAMETMVRLAKNNDKKIREIHDEQLIGFEIDPVLFTLACSNMFLHGDGRSKLIFRSSLLSDEHENIVYASDEELFSEIRKWKPTKVIINPPYENNKPILFTLQALKYLEPNGKLIIIMPTPTLTHNQKSGGLTEEVLKNGKLDFVIKMPERLFSEQKRTVNTSIFGFTKTPQQKNDKVLFYDLSDDGFVSKQHKGRIDKDGRWHERESKILDIIFNNIEISGVSEKRNIYSDGIMNCAGIRNKGISKYELVKIGDLFKYNKGTLASEDNDDSGEYDFITASSEWKKHNEFKYDEEALVYAVAASGSLGRCHYVNGKFIASNLCIVLFSKNNYKIHMQFYQHYFDSKAKQIRNDLADGTSKLTINPDELMEYYIEYIPYEEQVKFYNENIKPVEDLEKKLKEAKEKLNNGINNQL